MAYADERLGACLMADGQPDAAEPLPCSARSIETIYRATKSTDSQGMASAVGDLGMLLQRKGDSDAAEPLLRESMETWQKVPGYESFMWATISPASRRPYGTSTMLAATRSGPSLSSGNMA